MKRERRKEKNFLAARKKSRRFRKKKHQKGKERWVPILRNWEKEGLPQLNS